MHKPTQFWPMPAPTRRAGLGHLRSHTSRVSFGFRVLKAPSLLTKPWSSHCRHRRLTWPTTSVVVGLRKALDRFRDTDADYSIPSTAVVREGVMPDGLVSLDGSRSWTRSTTTARRASTNGAENRGNAEGMTDDDNIEIISSGDGDGDEDNDGKSLTDLVEQPAKVMRIGTMIKQLLEEVRAAPLDEASRNRLREIHRTSIRELEDGLAPELRIAQAQLVGWLEGLFHGIQTALFAQQMAARQQLEQMRGQGALPPGLAVRGGPPQSGTGQYL
jgi:hypothetical protein